MEPKTRRFLPALRAGQRPGLLAALTMVFALLAMLGPACFVQAAPVWTAAEPEDDDPPLEMTAITVEDIRNRMAPPEQPTPRSIPTNLLGKIIFLADLPSEDADTTLFALDPATGGLWELNESWPHQCAEQREAFSANRQYQAFLAGEWMEIARPEGEDGEWTEAEHRQQLQLKYYDHALNAIRTLSHFGARGTGPYDWFDTYDWAQYGHAWDPAWSPAADLIAFVSNETRNEEIYVVAKDQWPPRQLTRNDWAWDKHPSWSPDGKQIVFESNRDGQQRLWLMNADGSNQRPLTDPIFSAQSPVWVKYVGSDGCP